MAYGAGDKPGAPRPRKRKQPPGPPNFPTAVPVRPGAVTTPTTRGHGPPPPPKSTLGAIPKLERAPGQHAAQRAGERAARAQPAPVLPQVPIIRNPTPHQVVAAKTAISAGLSRESKARGQDPVTTMRQLASDPRTRHFAQAAQHYARADEQQTALMVASAAGIQGGRAQKLRAGRILIARHQARNRFGPAPKRKVVTLGPASLPIGTIAKGASRFIGAHTSIATAAPENIAFRKVAADAASLGTFPFIAGYETGAGVADVARGKGTGRLQREASQFIKAQVDMVRHPLKFAGEHPGLAALTFAGGVGALGRVAGAGARTFGSQAAEGRARGTLARAGSTVRPPLALSEDANAPLFRREFSKDATRKVVQMSNDSRREPLLDKSGEPVTVMDRGQRVTVLKARPKERERLLKGEANFRAARANAEERKVRDRVNHEFRVRKLKGPAKDLVSMVVEGTISSTRHFADDLRQHAGRIEAALERERQDPGSVYRHPGEVASAEHRLAIVRKTLASPKVMAQAERIVNTGVDIGRRLNEREREAIRLGILNPKRAARSRLIVPAVEHLGARHFTPDELKALPEDVSAKALEHGAMRREDGTFLSSTEIEDALRAKGRDPSTVAYLPHRFDVRGRRAFHSQFRPGTRPTIDKPGVRTGALYARGGTEASPELIREQAARLATQTVKTGHLDQMIGELGLKHESGRYFTGKEAKEFADRLERTTGERLTPVSAFPAKAGKRTEKIAKGEQNVGAMQTLQEQLLNKRLKVDAGAKNVVLVPTAVIEQTLAHLKPAGTIEKFFQAVNPAFRLSVLPQPRWLTGNFVEPYLIRLSVEGSGLVNIPGLAMDLRATSKILDTMRKDPDPAVQRAAAMLEAQQIGQGLFIGGRGVSVRRELAEFGKAGKAAAFFRQLPVMKQATDLFLMLPHSFFALNRIIESGAQRAAFGRLARRDLREFTGSWIKAAMLQRQAMTELAHGLTDTATQRRFMRAQHTTLGQYEGFPPALRRLTQSATPFIPWYLNSLRFVYWTMPVHHTTLSALAAQVGLTYQKDWEQMHKDVPPGSLKFAIPTAKGGWVDLARYTPYGATTEPLGGGSWQSFTDQLAPQFSGAIAALGGKDPFGRDLQVPKTPENPEGKISGVGLLGVFANQLASGFIPLLSTTQRLREGGGTPYATSNVISPKTKPGSKYMSGARRTFDPFRPTYLKGPSGAPTPLAPLTHGGGSGGDRLMELRRAAAARQRQAQGSSDRLMELRRAAAARARR